MFLSDDGNGAGETLREIGIIMSWVVTIMIMMLLTLTSYFLALQATGGRQQPSSGVSKLAIAPAGDIVVTASLDGCVRPWKMEYNF